MHLLTKVFCNIIFCSIIVMKGKKKTLNLAMRMCLLCTCAWNKREKDLWRRKMRGKGDRKRDFYISTFFFFKYTFVLFPLSLSFSFSFSSIFLFFPNFSSLYPFPPSSTFFLLFLLLIILFLFFFLFFSFFTIILLSYIPLSLLNPEL